MEPAGEADSVCSLMPYWQPAKRAARSLRTPQRWKIDKPLEPDRRRSVALTDDREKSDRMRTVPSLIRSRRT